MSDKVENPLAKFVAVVNNQCRCGSLGDFTVAGIRETLRDALYEYETATSSRAPEGASKSPEPYNLVSDLLGKYLNTMVADLGIEGKGQYLRYLFSKYEAELARASRPAGEE